MRHSILITFITSCLFIISPSSAYTVQCSFRTQGFHWITDQFYICRDEKSIVYTREDRYVDDVSGTHLTGMTNDQVTGFYTLNTRFHYVPKHAEKFFKNLRVLAVEDSRLIELRREDLMPYPNVEYLYFSGNLIEVLEKDLLIGNPRIKGIAMERNHFRFIHSKIFDGITRNLSFLMMDNAGCVSIQSQSNFATAIATINEKCSSYDSFTPMLTDLYFAQRYMRMV
ncbi:unnamed protein product [Chironomus riparius]|uniref:Uncharacterized protein n=1 Tax=Chironomus riparius TaxID=315576 RepID=A0A9N9S9Y7_9DIPT|nr:unnamed protein product [Chironomus riparius]